MFDLSALPFLPLLIVCGLAFLIPMVASRFPYFELPVIVAEIIAGIALGNSGLGIITIGESGLPDALLADNMLNFLSLFGFVFLMFISGLEVDFTQVVTTKVVFERGKFISSITKDPIYLGIIYFMISLVLCYIAAAFLVPFGIGGHPMLMALIFTTTSVGIVIPTLHQTRICNSEYGQNILIASLVADFSTMLLVTVAFAAVTTGLSSNILYIGFIFVAFFVIYKTGSLLKYRPKVKKAIVGNVSRISEIRVRGAFVMMLLFIVLAEILDLEIILGAFLAGAAISMITTRKETKVLTRKLRASGYGFFIPIFFIMVGVKLDLGALFESHLTLIMAPLLILIAFVVKLVPAHIFSKRYGSKKAVAAGLLMASRLTLIIAVAAIGVEIGVISQALNSAIILVAVVTSIVSPAIFTHMAKDFRKRKNGKRKRKGHALTPEEE